MINAERARAPQGHWATSSVELLNVLSTALDTHRNFGFPSQIATITFTQVATHVDEVQAGGVPPLFSARADHRGDVPSLFSARAAHARWLSASQPIIADNQGMHRSGACGCFLMVTFSVPTR
ncbi:hypothetical protein LF1_00490 [Rubripirellula obstinata]|uniref:Uncharacterized protein n=1 Tax=Rubripirellula obstinata TaxID=406547 RepID=A0A5B1CBH1_9BACT|nr:hypothetical protein LF1_00490 [Rubripirellula obstinata]